jgi:hypothetical protein
VNVIRVTPLFVRLYASRYPDGIVGMVLVDAVSEELNSG